MIFSAVSHWLERQDELTCAIHRVVVEEIQGSRDAPLSCVLHALRLDYPLLWHEHCGASIKARVAELFSVEFDDLSILFTGLFDEFNIRYFARSLPGYRVRIMHNVPLLEPASPFDAIQEREREIVFSYDGWPHFMVAWLLHLMALIRSRGEGETALQRELDRLRQLGAPTTEAVDLLVAGGWTPLSSPPWLPQ
jgi:hypothetical protein